MSGSHERSADPLRLTPRRPSGWRVLRTIIIITGAALCPVFFAVMFVTVTAVVRPSFGHLAWSVPAATEGAFAFLFLLDILLNMARKPMGWLRWTPYPFTLASLALNVWAYLGDLPGMLGHAAVTCAFFVPLIAAERAVRSMSVSDAEVAIDAERQRACRYARDLLRDRKGIWWRWRVPSLLRTQVLSARLPAEVAALLSSGPTAWEPAVRRFVVAGLTAGAWMQAEEKQARRVIERTASVPGDASRAPARKPSVKRTAKASGEPSPTVRAEAAWRENPRLWRKDITAQFGISDSSADRIQAKLGREGLTVGRALEAVSGS